MALDNVWVFAEATDGSVKTITLEMLAKAREIADEVSCFYAGDGDDVPHPRGMHALGDRRLECHEVDGVDGRLCRGFVARHDNAHPGQGLAAG